MSVSHRQVVHEESRAANNARCIIDEKPAFFYLEGKSEGRDRIVDLEDAESKRKKCPRNEEFTLTHLNAEWASSCSPAIRTQFDWLRGSSTSNASVTRRCPHWVSAGKSSRNLCHRSKGRTETRVDRMSRNRLGERKWNRSLSWFRLVRCFVLWRC